LTACAAALSLEGVSTPTMVCRFCGSTVIIPDSLHTGSAPPAPGSRRAAETGLKIKVLLRQGKKILAVRLHSES
jgi:hypothetical protein